MTTSGYCLDDTIAAIASPAGGAARGIVRISGPEAIQCIQRFFREGHQRQPSQSPTAVLGTLQLPELHAPLPCDVYVWPGRGYTGQTVVEIHTIGSPPLLQVALRAICAAGARLAAPGEFTLRAFLAGRIDLTQAEAVLGVIDAADSRELDVALAQLAGGLARPLEHLRDTLLDLLAHLEAGFDFADEDIEFISPGEVARRLATAENETAAICDQLATRADASHAIRVVLVGRPNTGKSSLLNAIVGDATALVSEHAGTTRDYLTADIQLDGVWCRLIDTAGEADTEQIGGQVVADSIARQSKAFADEQRSVAGVRVLCIDSTRPLDGWERAESTRTDVRQLIVLTKCDVPRRSSFAGAAAETSSVTGHGIASLRTLLRDRALTASGSAGSVVACTAARSADSLRRARQCLGRAKSVAAAGQEELVASELRAALEELGKVVGTVYTEDVLDRIFSRFCVGK